MNQGHPRAVTAYRDYENAAADVLGFLFGDAARVERNVWLPGRKSDRSRQIDIVVRGLIFDLDDALMIVDCKRWTRRIDIKGIEAFLGMVDDVGADIGMIISTRGATVGARNRIRQERARIEAMSLEDLKAWRPPGTVLATYRLPAVKRAAAEKALHNAGFRVAVVTGYEASASEVLLETFRHYGTQNPPGDVQRDHMDRCEAALKEIGIEPVCAANGLVAGGGTPSYRWLGVALYGAPILLRVLADTEDEAARQLDVIAEAFGVPRAALTVIKPEGWPIEDAWNRKQFGGAPQ
jgi:Restriction endonuclease